VYRTDGGAVGGTDVSCHSYRSYITITVNLWRYSSAGWQWISSGSAASYGNYWASAATARPSYIGGCAAWDITASVVVDGFRLDSTTLDYGGLTGRYPRYDPTHPSTPCY
jgi:hypothetical protein